MNNIQRCLLVFGLTFSGQALSAAVTTTPPIYVLPITYEYLSCDIQNNSKKTVTNAKIEIMSWDGSVLFTEIIDPTTLPAGIAAGTVYFYDSGQQPNSSETYYCRFTLPGGKVRGYGRILETKTVNNLNSWVLKAIYEAK